MARAWTGSGGQVQERPDLESWRRDPPSLPPGGILIDALFGTGLSRPLKGLAARVVEEIGRADVRVVSVDIPSGLFASDPAVPGPAVTAALTVTFARPKPAQLMPPAEMHCGELVVVDIGIPEGVVERVGTDLHWMTAEIALSLLPSRRPDNHKGSFGHLLVVGGSEGKSGAAALCGWGGLRSGAGLATIATPGALRGEVAAFAPELMTEALGTPRSSVLGSDAHRRILELLPGHNVLALGPGLGQTPTTQTEIRRLIRRCPVPVVLDADGLNAFAGSRSDGLGKHRSPLVLTPHPGEAARLLGTSPAEVQADRLAAARKIARQWNAVCVLKGYRTLTADAEGQVMINSTGNPGMATGGMGDLLTGMIGGLLAQGLEPFEAAALGAYLHGRAADLALEEGESEPTLTATAVAGALPGVFRALEREAQQ